MNRTLLLTAAIVAFAGATSAQTITTPSAVSAGTMTPGASSLSANVASAANDTSPGAKAAVKRIEADGYKNVQGLQKGAKGMWQGTAMRGSAQVQVMVDARGNVSAK